MNEIRERSGYVNSKDKLVCFLYILLRDYLPTGTIEGIVEKHCINKECFFSNGWLANYAKDLAERLKGDMEEL